MNGDVQDTDRALVATLATGDGTAAPLLDDDFKWVDADGRVLAKLQLARTKPPLGDEAGLTPSVHRYGDVATVMAGRHKVLILRIWVKRASGWRLLTFHELSQAGPPAPHGAGRKEWDNPCRTIPYEPRNNDERDCLASWQALEVAVMTHEPDEWARHVADEFVGVGATRRHSKADRKAAIEEQRCTNADSAPAPLVWAELFDFPDAIVMCCEHQPFHGKAARVSRVFIKRDGQWLMVPGHPAGRAGENHLDFYRDLP